jgi:trimeric autotransporter adhesin
MKHTLSAVLFALLLCAATACHAQYMIKSVAGTGALGFSGDGGPATAADLRLPLYVCTDAAGNLYISDQANQRIRKVDVATGIITTVAGKGGIGNTGDGGPATDATMNAPKGICIDKNNNLYICANPVVRKVNLNTGIITTFAGNGTVGYSGDGGPATNADMSAGGVALSKSEDNIYILGGAVVRKVNMATGIISTICGTNVSGSDGDGGPATDAKFGYPYGIAVGPYDHVYITDLGKIRKIDAVTGIITTVAGTGTGGYSGDGGPATNAGIRSSGVAVDSMGNIYTADVGNYAIRKVDAVMGVISTIAGNGTLGYSGDGGPAIAAQFTFPWGLCVNKTGSVVYIADRDKPIRKVYMPGVGVDDVQVSKPLHVYPNPTNGSFTVAADIDEEYSVTVYNAIGQRVFQHTGRESSVKVDISLQPDGVYFVWVSGNDHGMLNSIVRKMTI